MVAIRKAQEIPGAGVPTEQGSHFLKAFADDLTIITRSKDLMNKVWASLKEGFEWCGLLANAKKCRYLTFHKGELLEEEEVELGDGTMVPGGTKHGASFLGCDIPVSRDPDRVRDFLVSSLTKSLEKITSANYGLKAKLFFYELRTLPLMRWYFTIYPSVTTDTARLLQQRAWQAMTSWARGPRCMSKATFTLQMGYSVPDLRSVYAMARCMLVARGLKDSDTMTAAIARQAGSEGTAYNKTTLKFTKQVLEGATTRDVKKAIVKDTERRCAKESRSREVWRFDDFDEDLIKTYNAMLHDLPEGGLRWAIKSVSNGLLTRAWWHMVDRTRGASCPICLAGKQSIGHILNGCQTALTQGRFTYRHDAVLRTMLTYITKEQNTRVMWKRRRVWADVAPYNDIANLPQGYNQEWSNMWRPDIIISPREGYGGIIFIELTCPLESNATAAHKKKYDKYKFFAAALKTTYTDVRLYCVEMGSRGVPQPSFGKLKGPVLDVENYRNMTRHACRTAVLKSWEIYQHANDPDWRPPPG